MLRVWAVFVWRKNKQIKINSKFAHETNTDI